MSKDVVAEKAVEKVAEAAEPVVEAVTEPAKAILPKIAKGGDMKVVVGTVVVAGGIIVGAYILKKKINAKKAAKVEKKEGSDE